MNKSDSFNQNNEAPASAAPKKARNIGADVVRCIACFSVVSVHFFHNNGFYENIVAGRRMYIMMLLRSFFVICVPLFMLLSGYLMRNKKPSVEYYKKLGKTIFTYVLASGACILYSALFLKETWSAANVIFGILDYTASPYAWYVEMYIGLFLLIPFLNILYNNIPSKNLKKVLLLALIISTILPSVLNTFDINGESWWKNPAMYASYNKLIPSYWTAMYPLTYYFLGCYLAEYGINIKKGLNALMIIATVLVFGTFCFWRSYNSVYIWGEWGTYSSLFVLILSVLVFTFFINLNYSKVPKWLQAVFKKISALSFGVYLVSWIFDNAFYPYLLQKVPQMTDRLPYYFVMVPLVFVCSLLLSWVIELVQNAVGLIRFKKIKKEEIS